MKGLRFTASWLELVFMAAMGASTPGAFAASGERLAPTGCDRPLLPGTDAAGDMVSARTSNAIPATRAGYVLPPDTALAAFPAKPETDPQHVYTLAELIDLAHSTNPRAKIAWYETQTAALAEGLVGKAYAPKLSVTAGTGATASRSDLAVIGSRSDQEGEGVGAVVTLSLEWLLFDFGVRNALLKAAHQESIIANIALTAAHQQLIHRVALAFYDDVTARARSGNADQAVALAMKVQASSEARLGQGIGSAVEAAQARQATAQLHLAAVQASGAVADARVRLLTAIGLPPFIRLRIANAVDRKFTPQMADMAEEAVTAALSRRPDMLAALAARRASEEGVRAARAEFLPKVFAFGSATHFEGNRNIAGLPGIAGESPTFNLSGSRSNVTLLLGIRIPLFDGGTRRARLDQARYRAEATAAKLEETRDLAVLEIVAAENGLRSAIEATVAAEQSRAAAQISVDAALAAWRNGVGSMTDVNLAELQLLAASNVGTDAKSAALRAAATLALATGALGGAPD